MTHRTSLRRRPTVLFAAGALACWAALASADAVDAGDDAAASGAIAAGDVASLAGGGTLRSTASRASSAVTRLRDGAQVTVVERQGDWALVDTGLDRGWVMASALRPVADDDAFREVPALEPAAAPGRAPSATGGTPEGSTRARSLPDRTLVMTELGAEPGTTQLPTEVRAGSEVVVGSDVDLRASGSADAALASRVREGHRLDVLAVDGDWAQVRTASGGTGWILLRDLRGVDGSQRLTRREGAAGEGTTAPRR